MAMESGRVASITDHGTHYTIEFGNFTSSANARYDVSKELFRSWKNPLAAKLPKVGETLHVEVDYRNFIIAIR